MSGMRERNGKTSRAFRQRALDNRAEGPGPGFKSECFLQPTPYEPNDSVSRSLALSSVFFLSFLSRVKQEPGSPYTCLSVVLIQETIY